MPYPWHAEVPRSEIKPAPPQWPEPQQWQYWILNPLSHKGIPTWEVLIIQTQRNSGWWWKGRIGLWQDLVLSCIRSHYPGGPDNILRYISLLLASFPLSFWSGIVKDSTLPRTMLPVVARKEGNFSLYREKKAMLQDVLYPFRKYVVSVCTLLDVRQY